MNRNNQIYLGNGLEFADLSQKRGPAFQQQFYDGYYGCTCGTTLDCFKFFDMQMQKEEFHTYLEIGTFDGVFISMLARNHPTKKFIAIDAFMDASCTAGGSERYFIQNNKDLNNVCLYSGKSIDWLPQINEQVDLVFIDGDHSYDAVKFESNYLYSFLKPGGVMCFHDYNMPTVRPAILEFCQQYQKTLIESHSLWYIVR